MLKKSVVINGHKTSVKLTNKIPDGSDFDGLGIADLLDDQILIHQDLNAQAQYKIFLHEIFHHHLWRSGADQTLSSSQVESLCQGFAYLYMELKRQKV